MAVDLDILWEGNVPGLQEQRLSVGEFGEPLTAMLAALRRIATRMVGDAIDGEGPATGRFAAAAKQLDIQISEIKHESSGFAASVAVNNPEGQMELFNGHLPEEAAIELLDAIEAESKGTMKNSAVRRYLRSLPSGISRQTYRLFRDGILTKTVIIGSMSLPEALYDLPYIIELTGNIIGVGFEPGRNEIRFRSEDGTQITASASALHVNNAIELRGDKIRALVLMQDIHSRVLRVQQAQFPWPKPLRELAIFEKWGGLLRRLAQ